RPRRAARSRAARRATAWAGRAARARRGARPSQPRAARCGPARRRAARPTGRSCPARSSWWPGPRSPQRLLVGPVRPLGERLGPGLVRLVPAHDPLDVVRQVGGRDLEPAHRAAHARDLAVLRGEPAAEVDLEARDLLAGVVHAEL